MVRMRRRELLLGVAGTLAALHAASAQQAAKPVVGFLGAVSPAALAAELDAFRVGLAEGGFNDGRNVKIVFRWAEGHYDRLPALAKELVAGNPNVLVAATLPAALPLKALTTTIPIVFFSGGDPVQQGLVASFNQPGGNLTGACAFLNDLGPKRLELLLELVPEARVFGFLVNSDNPNAEYQSNGMRKAAAARGRRLVVFAVRTPADIDAAVAALAEQHGDGLVVGADPFFGMAGQQIAALAARYRLPAVSSQREFAAAGGLIGYGNDIPDVYHQVGVYAGRVLGGARPADLPVVRASKFRLFVSLTAAKSLGVSVPQSLLLRADEVIE